jgi:hypothetical protein
MALRDAGGPLRTPADDVDGMVGALDNRCDAATESEPTPHRSIIKLPSEGSPWMVKCLTTYASSSCSCHATVSRGGAGCHRPPCHGVPVLGQV